MIKYSIVSADGLSVHGALVELTREVNVAIAHGWVIQGCAFYCGVDIIKGESRHIYGQTVAKAMPPIDYKTPIVVGGKLAPIDSAAS